MLSRLKELWNCGIVEGGHGGLIGIQLDVSGLYIITRNWREQQNWGQILFIKRWATTRARTASCHWLPFVELHSLSWSFDEGDGERSLTHHTKMMQNLLVFNRVEIWWHGQSKHSKIVIKDKWALLHWEWEWGHHRQDSSHQDVLWKVSWEDKGDQGE